MTLALRQRGDNARKYLAIVALAANDPSKMDIPGLSDLPARLLSQCGLVTAVLLIGIVWLAVQLAKTRAGWETDRVGMMKLYTEQNEAYEKIAVSHAKLEGMLYGIRGGSTANDDD